MNLNIKGAENGFILHFLGSDKDERYMIASSLNEVLKIIRTEAGIENVKKSPNLSPAGPIN